MKAIEFPAGSGRVAEYDDREVAAVKGVIAAAEDAGARRACQVEVLHDLKLEFGIHLVDDLADEPVNPIRVP